MKSDTGHAQLFAVWLVVISMLSMFNAALPGSDAYLLAYDMDSQFVFDAKGKRSGRAFPHLKVHGAGVGDDDVDCGYSNAASTLPCEVDRMGAGIRYVSWQDPSGILPEYGRWMWLTKHSVNGMAEIEEVQGYVLVEGIPEGVEIQVDGGSPVWAYDGRLWLGEGEHTLEVDDPHWFVEPQVIDVRMGEFLDVALDFEVSMEPDAASKAPHEQSVALAAACQEAGDPRCKALFSRYHERCVSGEAGYCSQLVWMYNQPSVPTYEMKTVALNGAIAGCRDGSAFACWVSSKEKWSGVNALNWEWLMGNLSSPGEPTLNVGKDPCERSDYHKSAECLKSMAARVNAACAGGVREACIGQAGLWLRSRALELPKYGLTGELAKVDAIPKAVAEGALTACVEGEQDVSACLLASRALYSAETVAGELRDAYAGKLEGVFARGCLDGNQEACHSMLVRQSGGLNAYTKAFGEFCEDPGRTCTDGGSPSQVDGDRHCINKDWYKSYDCGGNYFDVTRDDDPNTCFVAEASADSLLHMRWFIPSDNLSAGRFPVAIRMHNGCGGEQTGAVEKASRNVRDVRLDGASGWSRIVRLPNKKGEVLIPLEARSDEWIALTLLAPGDGSYGLGLSEIELVYLQ